MVKALDGISVFKLNKEVEWGRGVGLLLPFGDLTSNCCGIVVFWTWFRRDWSGDKHHSLPYLWSRKAATKSQ